MACQKLKTTDYFSFVEQPETAYRRFYNHGKNCKSDGLLLAYFDSNYDASSRITDITREDDTTVYYTYDNNNQLTNERWLDSVDAEIYAFEWAYDPVGNRTYQNDGSTESYYTYDVANELTQCHDATADTYTYYSYDECGNMLQIKKPAGTTYFEYNDAQLVENIHYSNDSWAYFYYDALLRRYAVNDGSGLSYFTWDANGVNLLSESDNTGTVSFGVRA